MTGKKDRKIKVEMFILKFVNGEKFICSKEEYSFYINNPAGDYITLKTINGNYVDVMKSQILLGIRVVNPIEGAK